MGREKTFIKSFFQQKYFYQVDHHHQLFRQLRVHLLLNLSRGQRRLGRPREAAETATEALKARQGCVEAFHARARAYR